MTEFNILQWNCKGLRTRAEQLKALLRDANPAIICLQETKLGPAMYNPGLNYQIFSSDPPPGERAHGGAAIIINKTVQCSHLPLNTHLQAVAVQVIAKRTFSICSLYIPPNYPITINELICLVDQLPSPFLLLGDFNAHNTLWGESFTDTPGRIIESFIDCKNLSLFNDGTHTYYNVAHNSTSAIDLSICSPEIYVDYIWSVNNHLNGSDHWPIHLTSATNSPTSSIRKWKTKEADWEKYTNNVNIESEFESFKSHLEAYDYLAEKL